MLTRTCLKCGHEATVSDDPAAACPTCGAIYAKLAKFSDAQLAAIRNPVRNSPRAAIRPGFYVGIWVLAAAIFAAAAVIVWLTPKDAARPLAPVTTMSVYDTSPPALRLAAIAAGSTTVSVSQANEYRSAMDSLTRVCLESEEALADTIVVGSRRLAAKGQPSDMLTLMRGVARSIPSGAGRVRCDEAVAAIVALTGTR